MKNDIKNCFKNVSKIQIAKYKIKSIYSIHGSKKYRGGVRCLGGAILWFNFGYKVDHKLS